MKCNTFSVLFTKYSASVRVSLYVTVDNAGGLNTSALHLHFSICPLWDIVRPNIRNSISTLLLGGTKGGSDQCPVHLCVPLLCFKKGEISTLREGALSTTQQKFFSLR